MPADTKFPERIRDWIVAFIGFATTVYGAVKLLREDVTVGGTVFLLIGISTIWATCLYVFVKKRVIQEERKFPKVPQVRKEPAYSASVRYLALACVIGIPAFAILGVIRWKRVENAPSDKIIILVADLDATDRKELRVTDIIVRKLKVASKGYADVQVLPLGRPITEAEGSDVAREEGGKRNASLVLWGWYGSSDMSAYVAINIEILHGPKLLVQGEYTETLTTTIEDLKTFKFQTKLSGDMAFLTLLISGLARYEANDYNGAIDRLTSALDQTTSPTEAFDSSVLYAVHFCRGNSYLNRGDYDRAIDDFDKAIGLKPDDDISYFNRGIAFRERNEYDRAIEDFNKVVSLRPDAPDSYFGRGNVYHSNQNYDRAIEDFTKAISLKSNYAEAYTNRGFAYYGKNEYAKAIADFDKAIGLKSDWWPAYNNRGLVYMSKGDYNQAITDYEKAMSLMPDYFALFFNRGTAYGYKGDNARALADFNKAVSLKRDSAESYANRGVTYFRMGNYDHTIADYDMWITLRPSEWDAYFRRGIVFQMKGDNDRAIGDYTKAIGVKPHCSDAYAARGALYLKMGSYDQAIHDCGMWISISPDDWGAYSLRGNALNMKRDYDRAIRDFTKAIDLNPNQPDPYVGRAKAYTEKAEYDRAFVDVKRASELINDPNRPPTIVPERTCGTNQRQQGKQLLPLDRPAK
jgi:tetratricopeptide (TPR) repeat protein